MGHRRSGAPLEVKGHAIVVVAMSLKSLTLLVCAQCVSSFSLSEVARNRDLQCRASCSARLAVLVPGLWAYEKAGTPPRQAHPLLPRRQPGGGEEGAAHPGPSHAMAALLLQPHMPLLSRRLRLRNLLLALLLSSALLNQLPSLLLGPLGLLLRLLLGLLLGLLLLLLLQQLLRLLGLLGLLSGRLSRRDVEAAGQAAAAVAAGAGGRGPQEPWPAAVAGHPPVEGGQDRHKGGPAAWCEPERSGPLRHWL